MATSNENPFVFPGMGQADPDLSGNPLMASMEMMRRAWAGLTGPGGLTQSLPMAPPMNIEELDKRIAELKSVEGWLSMNLSMLSSTIQGMEVQRATISTLRSFVDAMSQAPESFSAGQSPLEAVLGIRRPREADKRSEPVDKPKSAGTDWGAGAKSGNNADPGANTGAKGVPPGGSPAGGPPPGGPPPGGSPPGGSPPGGSPPGGFPFVDADAAQSASQAWWDMLQQQFKQLATATAATMPAAANAPAGSPTSAPPKSPPPKSARPASPRQKKAAAPAAKRAPKKTGATSARAPAKSTGSRGARATKKPSTK